MGRMCGNCKTDISHRHKLARFCSDKCRDAPQFRGTYCLWCGKELIVAATHKKTIKHCSRACSHKTLYKKDNQNFNEDYFSIPNLKNSYWAGFIAADGCVLTPDVGQRRLQISLKSTDGEHLILLKSAVGAGIIREYSHGIAFRATRITVVSNKICQDLEEMFKITPRKSLTLNPPNLTGDLAHAFIAGYIDGDGCYKRSGNRPTVMIRGTFAMLSWIAGVYGLDKQPKIDNGIYAISFHGDDALRVRDSFLGLGLPLMDRKINKWEEFSLNLKTLNRKKRKEIK